MGGNGWGTLMRYYLSFAPTSAFLASGIRAPARVPGLVPSAGVPHLLTAHSLRAAVRAIDIAAIAGTADQHLARAPGTEVKTGAADHRLLGRWVQRKCWIYSASIAILARLYKGTKGRMASGLTAKS